MKRVLFQLLLLFALSLHLFAGDPQFFYHTVQVGKTITISSNTYDYFNHTTAWNDVAPYDPSIISVSFNSSKKTFTIVGLRKGATTIVSRPQNSTSSTIPYFHIINVVDVREISIIPSINVIVGENYTYQPMINDYEASTTFTWTSSNNDVASISSVGLVSALNPGKSTITCTAANGVKAQSIVTVFPLQVSTVALSQSNCELAVGDNVRLETTVMPEGATNKAVIWFSGNENIAQVDENGNVTAIAPGYCSIYAIADDGSGKFGKCLVHVLGGETVQGDTNRDGEVTPQDASLILQYLAKKITW